MDQVFDKISQEVPYDAVSNLVNATITSYKDGKDQGLVNGTNDIDDKNSIIDRFYSNLTSDLIKQSDTNNPATAHSIGKQIGRFLVDNQNNLVEKTTEAFNNTTEQDTFNNGTAVFKVMQMMLKTNVIPMCSIYIKLNEGVKKLLKNGFTNKIKTVTPKMTWTKAYLKTSILNKVGEKQIECPFDDFAEFLRDSINVFIRNSDDEKLYHRYTEIYNRTSEIVSKVAQSINNLLNNIRNIDDISDSDINRSFDKIVENAKEIHNLYDKLWHDASNDDFIAWLPQDYKMNTFTFAIKPIESSVDKCYEGMTKADLDRAKKTKVLQSTDSHDKIICTSLNCPKTISQMIKEMQSVFGNINSEAIMTRTKKPLSTVLNNDMTEEVFWESIKKFNNASKTFAKNADSTISSLIDSTIRCAKIIGTLGSYTLRSIDKLKNTELKGKSLILSKLILSIAGYVCKDLTMVLSAMHYINANDLVMKLYLYDTTNNYLAYFAECLK